MRVVALVMVAGCGRIAFDARPIGDGGGGGDGDGSTDGGATAHCGGPTAITDNFADGVRAQTWYEFVDDPSMTVLETGGQLVITLANNVAGPNYAGYNSARVTDMRGSRAFIEVPGVPDPSTIGEAAFDLFGDPSNDVALFEESGMLRAEFRVSGTNTNLATIPYDAVAHRWWQIREAGGTVYFEYSSDGSVFTPFATTPTPSFASHARIEIYGGTFNAAASPGQSRFANLNGGGAPLEPWCKASTFQDDFTSGIVSPNWLRTYSTGTCAPQEMGGDGVITLPATGVTDCALVSGADFDLTASSAFVHVKTTPNTASDTDSYIDVAADGGAEVYVLAQEGTDIVCNEVINTNKVERCRTPYIPAQQSFWRLSEQSGSIVWEIGPDGVAWTRMASLPEPGDFTDVFVELGAGTNSATPSPGAAVFDAYNE